MQVTLVIGLPGSGKTTWARNEMDRLGLAKVRAGLMDDPQEKDDLAKGLAGARDQNIEQLFIVAPHLCRAATLDAAVQWCGANGLGVPVLVYFQNDPEQCLRNAGAADRAHKEVAQAIQMWSKGYAPPAHALPVFGH